MSDLLGLVRAEEPEGETGRERAGILDAALAAFLDFGIRRTSMAEVAKRARLSPATLYRRFAQKPNLVQAVGLREVRRMVARVERQIDREAGAEEQIAAMFVAFCSALQEHKLLNRLLATEPEVVLPLLTTQGEPVLRLGRQYLADFIRRLQAEHKIPEFDPEPVAEMIGRVALSLALTPQTVIPIHDGEAAARFAREHITVMFRL